MRPKSKFTPWYLETPSQSKQGASDDASNARPPAVYASHDAAAPSTQSSILKIASGLEVGAIRVGAFPDQAEAKNG